ncbi:MAG: DUF4198 domain-containing protein [Gammaproteobacteria bacterium]|nr:MAG: DUF4198 domain-containing protein [Gammaproteobacteria bacterium]
MKQTKLATAAAALGALLWAGAASAHFQMIIPSDDMVEQGESRTVHLTVKFWHPFEGHGMNMAKPEAFGVHVAGKNHDLLGSLKPKRFKDATGAMRQGFVADYKIRMPGDHIFYVAPKPYWEPAEETFIVHYTKVVVDAFGLEEGWDDEVGLKAEIVPLTRPYGLYAGNVFRGLVKKDGKPVPFAEVEVEYWNADGKTKAPASPMITQVVKADANGVFSYGIPKAGWWGFAALMEGDKPMQHDGKDYPVEVGALMWVKAYQMR